MSRFTESTVEAAALDWFKELGYGTLFGPDIAPGGYSGTASSPRRDGAVGSRERTI